ncbi:MAG: hypothetical protein IKT40_03390 [Bacilli bacterium]|nr:hypothetical protein [Bacilli bacterium]
MKYLRRDIDKLKQGNEWLKEKIAEIETIKKEQGTSYPIGIPDEILNLNRNVLYNDMTIEITEYYLSKVDPKIEEIKLGKYLKWYFGFYGGANPTLHMDLVLSNDTNTRAKLYDYVFGSHSGIREWVNKHIVPLISVILGDTAYSHAFGSWDLKYVSDFFIHCGKEYDNFNKKWELYYSFDKEKYNKDVEQAKKLIDWLIELSEKEKLMKDIDRFLDTYFEVVFKNNEEL